MKYRMTYVCPSCQGHNVSDVDLESDPTKLEILPVNFECNRCGRTVEAVAMQSTPAVLISCIRLTPAS